MEEDSKSYESVKYNVPQIVNIDFQKPKEPSPEKSKESDDKTLSKKNNKNIINKQKVSFANKMIMSPISQMRMHQNLAFPESKNDMYSPKGSIQAIQDQTVFNMVQKCNLRSKN